MLETRKDVEMGGRAAPPLKRPRARTIGLIFLGLALLLMAGFGAGYLAAMICKLAAPREP